MYIVRFYDQNIAPQDNLIIDYSILAPSLTLAKYYFYIKLLYILLIIGFYLHLMFQAPYDFDNINSCVEPKQATLNSLNRLVKDYASILVTLGAAHTVYMQYKIVKSQEETAKYQSNTDSAKITLEEVKISVSNVNQKFSAVNNVSTVVKNKLNLAESRTIKIENNLKEFWDTGEELRRLRVAYNNETDNFKKVKLFSEIEELSIKAERLFKSSSDEIKKSISEVNDSITIIKDASNPDQSSSQENSNTELDKNKDLHGNPAINDSDIKKSSIIDLDSFREWINDLSLIKQLAFTLIVGHGLILSIVVNILFILSGDKFISKFNLEERYPRIKKVIEYRKKFQKFYMINGIFLIVITSIIYISFGISILMV